MNDSWRTSRAPILAIAAIVGCTGPTANVGAEGTGGSEESTAGPDGGSGADPSASSTDGTSSSTSGTAPDTGARDTDGGSTSTSAAEESDTSGSESTGNGSEGVSCTVAADGCCSNLLGGGTDPDCPPLDCDGLQATAPIELPSVAFPNESRRSGTAMYWSGETLWTMRLDWADDEDPFSNDIVVIERRGAGGVLQEELHTELPFNPAGLTNAGPTSLAYHEGTERFALGYQASAVNLAAAGIDPDGTVAWNLALPATCSGPPSRIEAFSNPEGFSIGADENPCEGGGGGAMVVHITADGIEQEKDVIDFGPATSASFACGPDCDPTIAIYYDDLAARVGVWRPGDSAPSEAVAANIFYGGLRYSAAVFNGDAFFILTHEWPNANTRVQARGSWSPGMGWLGPRSTSPIVDQEGRPPALLWTGHGYVAAIATYPDLPLGENIVDADHTIVVQHFDLDGSLRGSLELDPGQAGLFPQLALVDGRVAITWVRVRPLTTNAEPYERYLSFLDCPL